MYKDRKNNKIAKGIIYLATFPNGKYYVGQTYKTLEKRKAEHKRSMKNCDYPIYRAMRKYGFENIIWEIIDTANSVVELDKKEMYWIAYYRSYTGFYNSQGYNANLGGGRNAIFGPLNDKELEEFGNDYRAGMSKDDLQKKYKIEHRWTLNSICAGRQWNEFTGIPPRDYKIWPPRTLFTPEQVDDILDKFKEIGRCEQIAQELQVDTRRITDIITGKKWSKYTGIKDKTFYDEFHRWSTILTNEEIKFIASERMSGGDFDDIAERFFNVKRGTLKSIWNGYMLSKFTKIPRLTEDEKIAKPGRTKMKSNTVDKILELHKEGKTGVEIAKILNISQGKVHNILEGKTWSKYTSIEYKPSKRKKLTEKEIKEIYELTNNGEPIWKIAKQFDVCYDSVYKIKTKRSYKNILK